MNENSVFSTMAILELLQVGPIGFKLAEAAWCIVGTIFVSNWRMRIWNVPVFALLITNTFGYALISILLIFINLSGKPRYFVCVILTSLGSALNFIAANLMVARIFLFEEPHVEDEKPYYYTSEGLLAFWMYLSSATMLLDVICNSPPIVIETHSSSEEEDDDEDGVRRRSQQTETT